jgi:YidC/Oxa1 family membrane protein insertase
MYGNEVNILPILMAVSMIFQSKMTMTDPKQKAMVYMMPVMMLLFFNSFPSGLNLYYTAFNVFTILQQKFITHETKPLKK